MNPRSFRPTRERVPGQHVHGFPTGSRAVSMVQKWHAEKEKLGKNDLDAREREELLYTLDNICTTVIVIFEASWET